MGFGAFLAIFLQNIFNFINKSSISSILFPKNPSNLPIFQRIMLSITKTSPLLFKKCGIKANDNSDSILKNLLDLDTCLHF